MNRETWLAKFASTVKDEILSSIGGHGGAEEATIRLSCGFPPYSGRKVIPAAVIPPTASEDFTAEIFISPTIEGGETVAALLLPLLKLAHVGDWRDNAPAVAKPLDRLPSWALAALDSVGEYPHARLEVLDSATKQSTRLLKAVCYGDSMNGNAHAAYIVRISSRTANSYGCPCCPVCHATLRLEN